MARAAGRLAGNVGHFVRLLRGAGLPIGPDRGLDALRALEAVGFERREDVRAVLAAVLVNRREHLALFDEAFDLFWRDPRLLDRALRLLLSRTAGGGTAAPPTPPTRRLAEALTAGGGGEAAAAEEHVEAEASLTWSAAERLAHRDFEQMSAAELAEARLAIAAMRLAVRPVSTRRFRPDARGRAVDPRGTLRQSLRGGAPEIRLARRSRVTRPPAVVILCDISGSMSRYSRMFLHFAHALTRDRRRVATLLFGTRLTDVTRHLRERDVDAALARAGGVADDWEGGTRIGACLHAFNGHWARRLLAQGAVVLLMTDGLDREGGEGIEREARRLRLSARRVIWLNPLLRYHGFEAKAAGVRALLPHVDELRAVHNLESLRQLAEALSGARVEGARVEGGRDDSRRAAGGG